MSCDFKLTLIPNFKVGNKLDQAVFVLFSEFCENKKIGRLLFWGINLVAA